VNVLIFKTEDGKPLAKVIDFAYSCLGQGNKDRVYLPQTSQWVMAPEWHPRGFQVDSAKTLDVFSFGMLCAWVLFRGEFSRQAGKVEKGTVENLLLELKKREQLLEAIVSIIRTADIGSEELQGRLEKFFSTTIAHDPIQRECNFLALISLLEQQESTTQNNSVALEAHEFNEAVVATAPANNELSCPDTHISLNVRQSLSLAFSKY
jgi:hypothetical protein